MFVCFMPTLWENHVPIKIWASNGAKRTQDRTGTEKLPWTGWPGPGPWSHKAPIKVMSTRWWLLKNQPVDVFTFYNQADNVWVEYEPGVLSNLQGRTMLHTI